MDNLTDDNIHHNNRQRPTDDAIEAIIHHATTSRPSDLQRPLRDTRTQLFVGNLPYRVRWQDLKDLFRKAGTVLRADVSLGPDNRSRGHGTVLLASAEDAGRAVDMFNGYTWQTRVLEVRLDRLMPEYEQGAQSSPFAMGGGGVVGGGGGYGSGMERGGGVGAGVGAQVRIAVLGSPAVGGSSSSLNLPGSSSGSGTASGSGSSPYTQFATGSFSRPSSSAAARPHDLDFGHYMPSSPISASQDSTPNRTLFVGNLPFHIQWQDLKDLFRQAGTILRADVALGPDNRSRGFGTVVFATDGDAERAMKMFNGYEFNGRVLKVHFDKFTAASATSLPFYSAFSTPQATSASHSSATSPLPTHTLPPNSLSQLSSLSHSLTHLPSTTSHSSSRPLQRHAHPNRLQLPPGYLYDYGPPSGPTSPHDMFGQLHQAQTQQNQEQQYFDRQQAQSQAAQLQQQAGLYERMQQQQQQHQQWQRQHLEQQIFERDRQRERELLQRERDREEMEREQQQQQHSRLFGPLDIDSLTISLATAHLSPHSRSHSQSLSSPSATSAAGTNPNSNTSSKPSSTKPLSLPLSLAGSGPGSASGSGSVKAGSGSHVTGSLSPSPLPHSAIGGSRKSSTASQHLQMSHQQQQLQFLQPQLHAHQHTQPSHSHSHSLAQSQPQPLSPSSSSHPQPPPLTTATSSGSVKSSTTASQSVSTSASEMGEVDSTAPSSSHPSPFLSHDHLRDGSFEEFSSPRGMSHSRRPSQAGSISSGVDGMQAKSGRAQSQSQSQGQSQTQAPQPQTQTQKVPYHPGPISLPPHPPLQFPMHHMMMPMPLSPHTPHAHAMALANMVNMSPLHHPGAVQQQLSPYTSPYASPYGSPFGMPVYPGSAAHAHAQAQAHAHAHAVAAAQAHHQAAYDRQKQATGRAGAGNAPLTPHGLPPMTPGMPPFTFLQPPQLQMVPPPGMAIYAQPSGAGKAKEGRSSAGSGESGGFEVRSSGEGQLRRGGTEGGDDDQVYATTPGQFPPASTSTSTDSSGHSSTSGSASGSGSSTALGSQYQQQLQQVQHQHPHETQQQMSQSLHLNLASVHGAFSPGVVMTPGTFYGRPGEVPGYINAAVGAPVHAMHSPVQVHPGAGPYPQMQMPPPVTHGAYFYAMSSPRNAASASGMEPQGYFDPMYFPAGAGGNSYASGAAAGAPAGGPGGSSLVNEVLQDKGSAGSAETGLGSQEITPPENSGMSAASSSSEQTGLTSWHASDEDEDEDDYSDGDGKGKGKGPEAPSRTHSVGHTRQPSTSRTGRLSFGHATGHTLIQRSESDPLQGGGGSSGGSKRGSDDSGSTVTNRSEHERKAPASAPLATAPTTVVSEVWPLSPEAA